MYIDGQEHAVLHLLYARFWHKVLFDLKVVPTKEPFQKIINQGMILGTDNQKMSKSKGNVINPDDIVEESGADTLRLYEMFMGPLEDTKPWSEKGVKGIRKWLDRVYRVIEMIDSKEITIAPSKAMDSSYNKMVKEVTEDIESMKLNTAISKMMIFINDVYKNKELSSIDMFVNFSLVLSLFAPHMAEEMISILVKKEVSDFSWPSYDEAKIKAGEIVVAVQVNGKLRGKLEIDGSESKEDILKMARELENVEKFTSEGKIVKEIYIPNKIVNIVVK